MSEEKNTTIHWNTQPTQDHSPRKKQKEKKAMIWYEEN